jgi:hypothetical protein
VLLLGPLIELETEVQARLAHEEAVRKALAQQRQRLLELYAAVDPDGRSWCFNFLYDDICQNPLFSCNGEGLVTEVGLGWVGCDLHGTLPASLGTLPGFPALQLLDLSNNPGLHGTFPPEWGTGASLAGLRVLNLWNTGLTGGLPSEWGTGTGLASLHVLRVGGTGVAGPLPEEWCSGTGLASVTSLSLQNVLALNSSLPLECGRGPGLAKLRQLQLAYDNRSAVASAAGGSQGGIMLFPGLGRHFPNLQQLHVSLGHPSVRVTLPGEWAINGTGLASLTLLSITGPGLVGDLPSEWATGTGLFAVSEISITHTSLDGTLPATWPDKFGQLSNFIHINLEGNPGLGGHPPLRMEQVWRSSAPTAPD